MLAFTTFNFAQNTHSESKPASSTKVIANKLYAASIDSVIQFLLNSAANDFRTHGPSGPLRFRDVRIGYSMTHGGEKRYQLCGQFFQVKKEGKAQWIPFVTIKTSGYEQWIGDNTKAFCKDSTVKWEKVGDLSTSLQNRLNSMK